MNGQQHVGKAKRAMVIGFDGADPLFMKKLLKNNRLPNIEKLLEMGCTTPDMGMIGVLPTVTPPNWASLATGAYPSTHHVTCYWQHTWGNPLEQLDYGFSSSVCDAEFIWEAYAKAGKKSIIFNYPTAWPPRYKDNIIYIDGSNVMPFSNDGVDYETICFADKKYESLKTVPYQLDQSGADCIVEGEVTTRMSEVGAQAPTKGGSLSTDDSARQRNHKNRHNSIYAPIQDDTVTLPLNDGLVRNFVKLLPNETGNYDTIAIYLHKNDESPAATLKVDEWSPFIYDQYFFKGEKIKIAKKFKLLSLAEDGSHFELYVSFAQNMESRKYCYPPEIATELLQALGPQMTMTNAVKYTDQGNQMVVDCFREMILWAARAISYLLQHHEWSLFYTHMHPIDLINHWYINEIAKDPKNEEVIAKMYEVMDEFVGILLPFIDEETVLFLCSDHGALPHAPECSIPSIGDTQGLAVGILRELGYCYLTTDENGKDVVDWSKTKAVSQRLTNIYLNVKGREPYGIVEPEEYDDLVEQIISDLYNYRDPKTGRRVVTFALKQSEMELVGLDGTHTGDIFFQLENDFSREHGNGLSNAQRAGHSLRCLLIAAGAGIKKNTVIDRKVRIVDIVPTICHLQNLPLPEQVEGAIVYQMLEQ